MPEIIDLYNNARQIVRTAEKHEPIPDGLNKVAVHIWVVNSKGEFLLQQRLATAKKLPNMWGQIGGGVQTGETSWDACVRECSEEMGLTPTLKNSILVGTWKRPNDFVDVWLMFSDVDIKDLRFQETEVQNAKWATLSDIEQMLSDGIFIKSILPGLQMVRNYLDALKK